MLDLAVGRNGMIEESLLMEQVFAPGAIRTVFQPVFDLSRGTPFPWGVECLSRGPRGTHIESAGVLFESVRQRRRESELDKICLQTALSAASHLKDEAMISMNVHASTLVRDAGFVPWFLRRANEAMIQPRRVVLEIVEQGTVHEPEALLRALLQLRAEGVRVALDDIGAGNSSLRLVVELAPEILKIDRFFIAQAGANPRSRAVLAALVDLADNVGASVVVEGVENRAQLAMAFSLGVRLVQGFGLCEPLEFDDLIHRVPAMLAQGSDGKSP